jgi:hypothetical protein
VSGSLAHTGALAAIVARMVFATGRVLREFEAATGVRLKAMRDVSVLERFQRRRTWRRLGLPQVDLFKSGPADNTRFGGKFWVRISHTDDPDRGVEDSGFHGREIERGPDAGKVLVAASAHRANVQVTFWPDANEANSEVRSAWEKLTAFLGHL